MTAFAHAFASLVIAALLVVAGAMMAEHFNLPFVHAWALAHGSIFILFPLYFVVAYLLLWPVVAGRTAGNAGSARTRPPVLALAAFVASIIGVVFPFGIVSLAAVVMAVLALRRSRTSPGVTGKGFAWTALVVGGVGILRQLYFLSLMFQSARGG